MLAGIESRTLLAWEVPRVTSATEALHALQFRRAEFKHSKAVGDFQEWARAREGVKILDHEAEALAGSPYAIACLIVAEGTLMREGAEIRKWCDARRLVLFDFSEAELVLPRAARARTWPAPPSRRLATLRRHAAVGSDVHQALAAAPPDAGSVTSPVRPNTFSELRDVVRRSPAGAVDLSELRLPSVPLPFRAPDSMDFVVASTKIPHPITPALTEKILRQLSDSRTLERRKAAVSLGSWPESHVIDEQLAARTTNDPDPLTRAMSAFALAARGYPDLELFIGLAGALIREARSVDRGSADPDDDPSWHGQAASRAALAAAVAVGFNPQSEACDRLRLMLADLATIPSERERAHEIGLSLAEICS